MAPGVFVGTIRPLRLARNPTLLLFAAALAVKAIVLFALHDHPLLQPRGAMDTAVYIELARSGPPPEPFFVSPLYLYFLRAIFLCGGGLLAARILQILLGAIAVALVASIARELFGERAGWIAGGLMTLTGVITFYEIALLQSALDPVLLAAALWLLIVRRSPLLAGLAAGLLALNRPNVVLWLAAVVILLLPRWRAAIAFAIGAFIAITPVTLRNWMTARELVLISSHGGLNFFIGNNAEADGTYHHVAGVRPDIRGQHVDSQRMAERAAGRALTSREVSRHFFDRAFDWIRAEPVAAVRLFVRKLVMTVNQRDIPLNHSHAFFALDPPLRLLVIGPWLVFPLAAIVLLRAPKPLWSFLVVYAVSVALFFVSTRYRIPLLVAAMPLAGGGVAALLDERQRLRKLAVAAAVAVPVLWNFGTDTGIANERAAMLFYEIEQGASPDVDAVAAGHPDPAMLYLRAGYALRNTKRHGEALAMFEKAANAPSQQPETRLAAATELVDEYMKSQRNEDALRVAGSLDENRFDADHATRLCRAAIDLRDGKIATRFCRRAAALRPSAPAHHDLGTAYVMTGDHSAALRELETAHRLDPRNASTLLNLAVLQAQRGDVAGARRNAREALRLRPDYAKAADLLQALGAH